MARPPRQTQRRVRMLPEVPLPPGQPAPPNVGGTTTTTTTVAPSLGPSSPTTTLPMATPPSTSPVNPSSVARTPETLQQMAAFGDELANVALIQVQDALTYTSKPLGFEAATSPIRVPVMVAVVENGEIQRDASGQIIMQQASGPAGPMFDTIYSIDPRFLPEDPWLAAGRQIAREVMSSTSTDPYAFLETPAARRMAELGGPRRTPVVLATEESIDKDFMTMTLDELNNVKFGLLQTGLIGANDIGDPTSRGVSLTIRNAARTAARLANFDGMDWKQFIGMKASEGAALGTEASTMNTTRAMPTIRVSSDADLRYVLGETSLKYLGRELSDDELAPMISGIQQQQEQFQRQAFAGSGGVVQEMPNVNVAAGEQIKEGLREEYDVFQMGNVMDDFRSILAGQI